MSVEYISTSTGFLEVNQNQINVVVESSEWAKDIDIDRAKAAKERAEKRIRDKENIDLLRAEAALARAVNRIKTASRA